MIDRAMLHRLMCGCGMDDLVINSDSVKLAQAIYKEAQNKATDRCVRIAEKCLSTPHMAISTAIRMIKDQSEHEF